MLETRCMGPANLEGDPKSNLPSGRTEERTWSPMSCRRRALASSIVVHVRRALTLTLRTLNTLNAIGIFIFTYSLDRAAFSCSHVCI